MRLAHGPIAGWTFDGRRGVLASVVIDAAGLVVNVQLEDGETAGFTLKASAVDPLAWTILKSIRDERKT